MPHQLTSSGLARRYWFYLLLPALLLASYGMSASADWRTDARAAEAALLFDWCLFVPALYALYLRPSVGGRALALRVLALACGGLWFARLLVPDTSEVVLAAVAPLRWIGIGVLVLAELAVVAALVRLTFSGDPDREAVERHGVPPLLARLMVMEARLWRRVRARLRGR